MNVQNFKIRPSKHFVLGWMRKWNYDIEALQNFLEKAEIEKVGKNKYEAYIHTKGKSRKIIFVMDEERKEIFIITGTEKT